MFYKFALIGTTASGKSSFSIELAKEIEAVILSLDSLCLYKNIDIASAKPNKNELSIIKHFGINLVYPDSHFCVGDFIKEYHKAKEFAISKNCPLIITGGSGFYLKSMLKGLSPKLEKIKIELNNDEIWSIAEKIDPNFTSKFSKNDEFRLHKWYQIYKLTNEIPTNWLVKNTSAPTIQNLKIYELNWDKEELKNRIKNRTKIMLNSGLIDEAKKLFTTYPKDIKALKSIGLKECGEYFEAKLGDIKSKEAILNLENLISIHTIQLAKKQRTFNSGAFKDRIILDAKSLKVKHFLDKYLNL
ncbi:tRNA (adenosine(37)-N6)-dimethylallyltransferase MiaA [Campylobacter fetus]|uniref:tRNA (adenosine(37)-N6)-dimethylallyltransferase MiaA n=1 Tax=Campylobacter fetus TaxID=196 RepID=UPI000531AAF7|nr:tRNA (adenosine(37)-N6)-dimethylallyltransferase MiaA [Campylobacter fetus]EAI5647202.1 tRNA (adenosine(37)-N6)-dimethylallyltransferase MiaA [Campylobacter fetus]EAI5945093.1 tRNA (adenosine(37)-N6)-dimethylallyltransferase MiaA [Campylobacter fetus]EAJ0318881.1 tRNA (adenosine(37)-N6)-dimethylallyltransferase MiaA [Campylobacter fetus]EAJ0344992.1 tRNA (adenosine(37)-N6)-dimethylallyltransferase MiaA [Campylobacter fetus]EAJ1238956.1 tRNA (adenosine(37)-N6)-dimethylallyltransferase MiaA [